MMNQSSQHPDDRRDRISRRRDSKGQRGSSLGRLPKITESEWRLACRDVAEEISRSWSFKLQVIAGSLAVILAVFAIFGYSTTREIKAMVEDAQKDAGEKIGAAKTAIQSQIKEEFRSERVKSVVEAAAASQASALLKQNVQPSIDHFNQEIGSRLDAFDRFLKEQQDSVAKDIGDLRAELEKLRKRNDLTALADRAIAKGDVDAYRKFESIAQQPENESFDAATAELFRLHNSFSIFAPSRILNVTLVASAFNSAKKLEPELTEEDILPYLSTSEDFQVRGRIAYLIGKVGKVGSFETAQTLAKAIQREKHLEVHRFLRSAFSHVTGYSEGGRLDNQDILEWWQKHADEVRQKDSSGK